jgi:hypothetical protein
MNTNLDQDMFSAYERVSSVKEAFKEDLLAKPNVIGVGVGLREREGELTDEIVLVVLVTKKLPRTEIEANDLIPTEIEGVPIDVQEVGEIAAGV